MHWIGLGLCSALLLGIYDIFRKRSLDRNAVLPVLWLSTVAAAVPFAGLLALGMVQPASGAEHLLILIKAVIVATSWVLEFFGLKHLALSVAAPVRASQPLFTLVGAVVLMGERMSIGRWTGVALTLGSYLFFSLQSRQAAAKARSGPWIWCALGAAMVGACSSLYDKYLFNRLALNPLTVQSWYTIYIAMLLAGVIAIFWWPGRAKSTAFSWRWSIPLIGWCLAASDALYFVALREPDALIAMLAAIRRANVAIAFAAGIWLFGEEGGGRRGLALAGILAGILVMSLS